MADGTAGPAPANPADAQGTRPVPDPTVLTTEQLLRAISAERERTNGQFEVRDERLAGIDRATELRMGGIIAIPGMIEAAVAHLLALVDERFRSVDDKFKERDTRSERESRDNKVAVDAAFAAQKEAAQKQDEASQARTDKSERATNENIIKLEQLLTSRTDALSDKIDDLRRSQAELQSAVNGAAQNRVGGQESTLERRNANAALYALAGFVVSLFLVGLAVVGFLAAGQP